MVVRTQVQKAGMSLELGGRVASQTMRPMGEVVHISHSLQVSLLEHYMEAHDCLSLFLWQDSWT